MAFCENCKTYTNNQRADSSGSFSCRNCGSPLIFAPSSGTPAGKGGKGSKKNQKLMNTKVVLQPSPDDPFMDMSENEAPAPKENATSGATKTEKKSSKKQTAAPKASNKDDFDDIPMPTIPQKTAKSQSPLILIAVGVVGLLLGLGIGVFVL